MADERDGARERASAELDAGDRVARRERREHQLTDERVAFGREDGLLAVDEKIALFAGREHDAFARERPLAEHFEEARARVHPRSALLLLRLRALLEGRNDG